MKLTLITICNKRIGILLSILALDLEYSCDFSQISTHLKLSPSDHFHPTKSLAMAAPSFSPSFFQQSNVSWPLTSDHPELSTSLVTKHDGSTCSVCRVCQHIGDNDHDADQVIDSRENSDMLDFQVEITILPEGAWRRLLSSVVVCHLLLSVMSVICCYLSCLSSVVICPVCHLLLSVLSVICHLLSLVISCLLSSPVSLVTCNHL